MWVATTRFLCRGLLQVIRSGVSNVHRLRLSDRIFFITVNLRRKLPPLADAEYQLVAAIEESRRKLEFLLLGYVLMPDHWHALIWPAYPLTISRVIQDIKWISSRSLNRGRHTAGAVWQHQFWDRFVRGAQELRERLGYMHLNPVKKGLVERPEQWRWSSYNNYELDKERVQRCPLQIDYVHLPQSYRG
jgi:putative transposase